METNRQQDLAEVEERALKQRQEHTPTVHGDGTCDKPTLYS